MILAILKKEFKQFFRSPGDLFLLFAFPIILITTLSVGLKNMMVQEDNLFGENGKPDIIYYSIAEEGSQFEDGFIQFKDGIEKELNIKFKEVDSLNKVKTKVDEYKALLHINVTDKGFELYSSKSGENFNTQIVRGAFENVLNEYATYNTIGRLNPEAFVSLVESQYDEYVKKDDSNGREVTSSEYYTFAELALIILYVSVTVGESVNKENLLNTIDRIRLSKVKESTIIGAKILFGICISVFQTILVYLYSTFALDVNWGENTIKFISLFIVFGIFASVIGAVVGVLSKSETTVNGVLNAIIVIICAFGGCYTPLSMIIGIPVIDKLVYLSPIYWINTATSSMVCGYDSSAYIIAIVVPIILSIIGIVIYSIVYKKKGGLQNV